MRLICVLGWLLLAGCSPQAPQACAFPGTSPMLVAELYFGRGNVPDAAWASFAADTLTARFPDGFTALDAAGQWREGPGQPIGREPSKVVIVAAPDTQATRDSIGDAMAAYRSRFDQKSVGLVLDRRCASF
jgi:hypothetical protein